MIKRIKKLFRLAFFLCIFFLISAVVVFAVSIAPIWGNAVVCVEVHSHHGDHVDISVPLSLIDTVIEVMPKELRHLCRDLDVDGGEIAKELIKMEGQDLVRIKGEDHVRVYVTNAMSSQGFVKVHVREGGRHGHNVHVWIPRGFVSFSGKIIKMLGLADKYIELPPEIKNLHVVEEA